jgi:hypothetical protein
MVETVKGMPFCFVCAAGVLETAPSGGSGRRSRTQPTAGKRSRSRQQQQQKRRQVAHQTPSGSGQGMQTLTWWMSRQSRRSMTP